MRSINLLKQKLKKGQVIILSGAMGTEIMRRGVKTTLPLWSADALFSDPNIIEQIHIDYINAGAEVITTNTFRTQRRVFGKANRARDARKATILACKLAENAIKKTGKKVFIGGSIAPLEDCYSPHLTPNMEDLTKEHLAHTKNLKDGGVDFLMIETMITIRETMAAIEAAYKIGLPMAVSFCCNDKFQLLGGEILVDAVKKIEPFNPIFVSINCIDQKIVEKTIQKLKKITKFPLGVYAQGDGQPDDEQGWNFFNSKKLIKNYVNNAKKWIPRGVQVIGGCCGTTPEYIKALKDLTLPNYTSKV